MPDALPGPELLQLVLDVQHPSQRSVGRHSDGAHEPIDDVVQQLQRLQEKEEAEEEKSRLPDAEEVYGKGLPYVLNPANCRVMYIVHEDHDGHDDDDIEEEMARLRRAESSMTPLQWILSPLFKRKGGVSFENPG
ncbi:hypothetical protein DQ04_07981000 [Trypanosoma grayi]|uniref:hypothetical protein n=1 Tax=Trypanosoma grayi TaxID=71804 RepID=UPI0004F4879A|nr:hypothetical protein DQ04_07981000 [Trypanosoma grayi]KEG08112.1 hypothetical protein DQ04_07981000 [Trypanosoma grayi]